MAEKAALHEARAYMHMADIPNRNDISFSEWMKLDLEYIDNWLLMLDFKLILKTVKVVLFGNGR